MGNNGAWTQAEEIIVKIYNIGKLDIAVLDIIGESFGGVDIDSGGSQDLLAKDGKNLFQIVVSLVHPDWEPGDPPENWKEDEYGSWEADVCYETFDEITSARWNW